MYTDAALVAMVTLFATLACLAAIADMITRRRARLDAALARRWRR